MSKSYRQQLVEGKPILVSSSNVHEIQWDAKTKTLTVSFYNGRTYTYDNVSLDTAEELCLARSKGRYMHDNIIDEYPDDRIG